MKRWVCGILVGMLLVGTMAAVTDVTFDNSRIITAVQATFQSEYTAVATLSACHGDPAVGDRGYNDIAALPDANCAVWKVPLGASRATFRFHINEDANTATVRAMTARSRYNPGDEPDAFNLAYQWAITGGTQSDGDGAVYCDTLTATAYALAGGTTGSAADNWIEEYEADLRGVSYMAWYRTDSDANLVVVVDVCVQ